MNETKRMTAKYAGRCGKCGNRFEAGTPIEWAAGAGASHQVCPDTDCHEHSNGCSHDHDGQPATMGVYRKDGRIYVVKPNKEKTRFYAKEIIPSAPRMTEAGERVDFETEYRSGMVYQLTEADRWNFADAQTFLTKYARCIVCGAHLKAAKSVAGAIGPVCAKYFATREEAVKAVEPKPEGKCTRCQLPFSQCHSHIDCDFNLKLQDEARLILGEAS
jgi:hypothetical protein